MKPENLRLLLPLLMLLAGMATSSAMAQAAAPAAAPAGRTPSGGLTPEREAELAQKHDGYLGALAPENLAKKRPKPPFDITGTWFINLRRSFADFRFGPPYPEFNEPGQTALREAEEARKAGKPYRDVIGQCYPAGMPMIMTRVWPFNAVQLPTVVYQLFGFTSSMRFIYLDGRQFTDPDLVVYTYNGESIGHWEKDALVVRTKYLEPNQHYIDSGIPISDQFEIVERYTMEDAGRTLRIDYTLTDPKMWKGEWKSTKRWLRQDYSDIPEAECLPNLNQNLPSTAEGQKAIEERSRN
ncbi:MAG: hypothetical protein ABW278_13740 [Steroidobacteraceae bacterium]